MLLSRSHWRFAFEQDPLREARLCAFANAPQAPDPLENTVAYASAGHDVEGRPIQRNPVDAAQDATREDTEDVLSGGKGPTEGEDVGKKEKVTLGDITAETFAASEDMRLYHQRMLQVEVLARRHLSGRNLHMWEENGNFIAAQSAKLKAWHTILRALRQWEAGNLSPESLLGHLRALQQSLPLTAPEESYGKIEAACAALHAIVNDKSERSRAVCDYLAGGEEEIGNGEAGKEGARAARMQQYGEETRAMAQGEAQRITKQVLEEILQPSETIYKPIHDDIKFLKESVKGAESGEGEKKKVERTDLDQVLSQFELEHMTKGKEGPQNLWRTMTGFPSRIGIEFYTINDIIGAVKDWAGAVKKSWEDYRQLKQAKLTHQIGQASRIFPGGERIAHETEAAVQHKDDESKNHHLEHIKQVNPNFPAMIHLLEEHLHDPNYCRAILEYAAGRGFLYDMDEVQFLPPNERYLFKNRRFNVRKMFPAYWSEQQFVDNYKKLLTENKNGSTEEEEKAYKRLYDTENQKTFVEAIQKELDTYNLWAAVGIAKRSIERGFWGEISPLVTATVYRKFKDPRFRQIATIPFLDRMGGLALYRSAFTLGHIKGQRNEILAWIRSGDENIRNCGDFGNVFDALEKEIQDKSGNYFNTKNPDHVSQLNRAMAQALSGQILTSANGFAHLKAGETITIFDEKYTKYRNNENIQRQGDLNPGVEQEDSDYYTGRTESVYANDAVISQILKRTGQSGFSHKDKAQNYMARILETFYDLLDSKQEAAALNYRRDMGQRLSQWMREDPLSDTRTQGLLKVEVKSFDSRVKGKLGIYTLMENGFLDPGVCIDIIAQNGGGREFGGQLLEENAKLNNRMDLYLRMQEEAKKYIAAKTPEEKAQAEFELEKIKYEWRWKINPKQTTIWLQEQKPQSPSWLQRSPTDGSSSTAA